MKKNLLMRMMIVIEIMIKIITIIIIQQLKFEQKNPLEDIINNNIDIVVNIIYHMNNKKKVRN
jgi:hypothetical protein